MKFIIVVCLMVLTLALGENVLAHGILGRVNSSTGIMVEAEYDDGEPMSYTSAEVFCCEEKLPFQSGRTDRNGRFLFKPDKQGVWIVVVKDEMSHQLKLKTDIDENSNILEIKNNHLQSFPKYQKVFSGLSVIFVGFGFVFWWKGMKNILNKQ